MWRGFFLFLVQVRELLDNSPSGRVKRQMGDIALEGVVTALLYMAELSQRNLECCQG